MVDTISSLASIDFRHDEWKVDVTVGGSQKGLLLPPGLSFNAVSPKALEAHKNATMPKHYWIGSQCWRIIKMVSFLLLLQLHWCMDWTRQLTCC